MLARYKKTIGRELTSPSLLNDLLAGFVSGLVNIVACLSLAVILFKGPLEAGIAMALAALLIGSAVTGLIIALTTSLPPADAGPDTPAIAVMSILAGTVASQLAASGASLEATVKHALMAVTISTLVTGLLLWALGQFRLGQGLRFIPYPVISGFLGASGILLVVGAIEVAASPAGGAALASLGALSPGDWGRTGIAIAAALSLIVAKRLTKSVFALPVALAAGALALNLVLWMTHQTGTAGWYLTGGSAAGLWSPMAAIAEAKLDWILFAQASAEIFAVCGVTAIALLLDISSLEVARGSTANLDRELRANGAANVASAMLGGVAGNLSVQSSVLIREAGAVSRWSGVFASLTIATVLFTGLDVTALIPKPLLAGLLLYLGYVILKEAVPKGPMLRSPMDLILAAAILIAILTAGYLEGVILGIGGACLLFAFNYSRIGPVRRHLTRADFSSDVEREPDLARLLRDNGNLIQVFWVSGYVFFGSASRLNELVRRALKTGRRDQRGYLILEMSHVTGLDSSALFGMTQLRQLCQTLNAELVFAHIDPDLRKSFDQVHLLSPDDQTVFDGLNDALEWCEDQLLSHLGTRGPACHEFATWLADQLAGLHESMAMPPENSETHALKANRILGYCERRELSHNEILYEAGSPAETIALVAEGQVDIFITDERSRKLRVRRMSGRTVVGEMGFFRKLPRAASVASNGDTVIYDLSRDRFADMLRDDPGAAAAFLQFIIRVLSDRVDFGNREVAALL